MTGRPGGDLAALSTNAIAVALQRALGMPVVALGSPQDFHNAHFRATTATGGPVFLKVFDDRGYWRRAITAAAVAAPLLRTPRLLEHGELGIGQWWISYEWLELTPFVATPAHLHEVGAMLGRLHRSTRGEASHDVTGHDVAVHDVDVEIVERTERLAALDAAAADRIRALHAAWGPTDLPGEIGLIHGDFHWRNVGLTDGAPVVFDLENVAAAHPIVDFGKLVDLDGLVDDRQRAAFFRGYERHAPPVWPWDDAIRTVRLWITCGVLVYSLSRGHDEFAAHGYRRLAELEALDDDRLPKATVLEFVAAWGRSIRP